MVPLHESGINFFILDWVDDVSIFHSLVVPHDCVVHFQSIEIILDIRHNRKTLYNILRVLLSQFAEEQGPYTTSISTSYTTRQEETTQTIT